MLKEAVVAYDSNILEFSRRSEENHEILQLIKPDSQPSRVTNKKTTTPRLSVKTEKHCHHPDVNLWDERTTQYTF
jgi:hypothetical protein